MTPSPERPAAPATLSLVDAAYEQIRQRILDNAWPPGHRALEQEVALALGMSRTPVREALMRLQGEGLVEVVPRHGMRVLPVSPTDMREIYEILTALECMAAELVARKKPTDSDLAPGFTEIVEWLDSADVWGDHDAFDLLDLEAEYLGGDFKIHWDIAKTRNGIDWPEGGYLIFADWFETGDLSRWSD